MIFSEFITFWYFLTIFSVFIISTGIMRKWLGRIFEVGQKFHFTSCLPCYPRKHFLLYRQPQDLWGIETNMLVNQTSWPMMTDLVIIQTVDTKCVSSSHPWEVFVPVFFFFFFPVYHYWLNDVAPKLPSHFIRYRDTSSLTIQHDFPVIFWLPVFREFSFV